MKQIAAYLKKLKELRSQRGFTMIELLIVISILGILAVAVLSAINPLEQINRGRDTGSRSDAEQLIGAIERFNAFQGYFPWDEKGVTPTAVTDVTGLYVWKADAEPTTNMYVCFKPQSEAFKQEAVERCDGAALPSDFPETFACPGGANPEDPATVYSCLP